MEDTNTQLSSYYDSKTDPAVRKPSAIAKTNNIYTKLDSSVRKSKNRDGSRRIRTLSETSTSSHDNPREHMSFVVNGPDFGTKGYASPVLMHSISPASAKSRTNSDFTETHVHAKDPGHLNWAHIVSDRSPQSSPKASPILSRKTDKQPLPQSPLSKEDFQIPEIVDTDSIDSVDSKGNKITNAMKNVQSSTKDYCVANSHWIVRVIAVLLLCGYTVYFVFALIHSVELARALIVLTILSVLMIIYGFIRDHLGDRIYDIVCTPVVTFTQKNWSWLQWVVIVGALAGVITYLAVDVIKSPLQLASIGGAFAMLCLLFLTSTNPDRVNMRPVVWGLGIQFVMGAVILRIQWAYEAVDWLSDQIQAFLAYVLDAVEVVFGDPGYINHPFIFVMMPMLIYFAAVMSILYYMGIIQVIVMKMGWLFQRTLGTTAVESLNSSANIFLNGMDTMIMLRPYLNKLTLSELQCLMTGNHTTVAGFAFALFILLGAPGKHLLAAAVMSAPAGVAVAKLNYPETCQSITDDEHLELEKPAERNIVEAAVNGAKVAGQTVVAVIVNFVAVLAILAFVNATLKWLGQRVGQDNWSFQYFCSYLFLPISLCMGIEWKDARNVASLVGLKIFTSEFLAYGEMGEMIDRGELSERSVAVTTYALCGFSGLATLAISVGVWQAIEPRRLNDVVRMMPRTMLNANFACFLTACYAGLLYNDNFERGGGGNNSTMTTPPPDFTWPPWLPIDEIIGCIITGDCDDRNMPGASRLNGTLFHPTPTVPMSVVYK